MQKYNAFVSCSIHEKDEPIAGMVELILERWGFNHYTVGRNVLEPQPPINTIKAKIRQADCLVGIATKRYEEKTTGTWRTFEWLHGEGGMAYGMEKPILVLKDKEVRIDGVLPAVTQMVSFDSSNPLSLLVPSTKVKMDSFVSNMRKKIARQKSAEFLKALGMAVAGIGAVAGAAGVGYYLGTRKKEEEEK